MSFRVANRGVRIGEIQDGAVRELGAGSLRDWIQGDGREPTGREHELDSVEFAAPLARVPSFRDFSAFEGHTRNIVEMLPTLFPDRPAPSFPDYWYEAPGFYFSNPAAFRGPGEPVSRPPGCEMLDYELEIAAVVGRDSEIAGFLLLNDWSARDLQMREISLMLGPHKSKDFSTSIGPWFVTPDELPYENGRLHLRARVVVNGESIAECDAGEQHFSWPALLEHAAANAGLYPGDLIGSGTLAGGCLLERGGLPGGRWLEPGDVVELLSDELGVLRSPIV